MYFAESLENEYEQELSERFRRGLVDGERGIATVVVEREVRVGERWYVSCFQCDLAKISSKISSTA
jgi:hypothetical protein